MIWEAATHIRNTSNTIYVIFIGLQVIGESLAVVEILGLLLFRLSCTWHLTAKALGKFRINTSRWCMDRLHGSSFVPSSLRSLSLGVSVGLSVCWMGPVLSWSFLSSFLFSRLADDFSGCFRCHHSQYFCSALLRSIGRQRYIWLMLFYSTGTSVQVPMTLQMRFRLLLVHERLHWNKPC